VVSPYARLFATCALRSRALLFFRRERVVAGHLWKGGGVKLPRRNYGGDACAEGTLKGQVGLDDSHRLSTQQSRSLIL